jgi:hypothetical protein
MRPSAAGPAPCRRRFTTCRVLVGQQETVHRRMMEIEPAAEHVCDAMVRAECASIDDRAGARRGAQRIEAGLYVPSASIVHLTRAHGDFHVRVRKPDGTSH